MDLTCKWFKVTKREPCLICGKPDWCTRASNGASCCMRAESPVPMKNGGWLHHESEPVPYIPKVVERESIDAAGLMAGWLKGNKPEWLEKEASNLGVAVEALIALEAAWSNEYNAWAWPMRNGDNEIVGIRLRNTARKWAVKGSHQGIFIPQIPKGKVAAITEGPTDTAAALSLGLFAIGRPCCTGGLEFIQSAFRQLEVSKAIVIADNDTPGIDGANRLMADIGIPTCLFIPPAKDLRAAVAGGLTRQLFDCMVKDIVWRIPR